MKSEQEALCRECQEIITGRKVQFYQWHFHVKCWNNLMGLVENKNIVKEAGLGPTKDRWKKRSRTLQGIAEAMADQWGKSTPVQGELF